MKERKPFIIIEGTDGSGKGTQTELLKQRLEKEGHEVAVFDFPRYGEDSALLVEAYLNGKLGTEHEVGPYVGSSYYAIDRFHAGAAIREALEAGKVVISNRYVASNMAHQGQKIDNSSERLKYFSWVHELEFDTYDIPRPDLNIVLLVEPEIGQKLVDAKGVRTYTDKKRDIHEANLGHLQRAYEVYKQITELYPDDFQPISCTKDGEILPIPDIHALIWEKFTSFDPRKKHSTKQTPEREQPMAGVYSNKEIKQAVKDGHIVFHPYREEHIAGSSVDVTLGEWYFRTERSEDGVYNPFDKEDIERYFDGAHRAMPHKKWAKKTKSKMFKGIPDDHPIIVLGPGERILAHTHEFIGIKPPGTSTMQARSSWGRNGVAVCLDAGWGDPGYINRWTMEIYNMNQHESVVLPVGERIAQLVFYTTGEVEGDYTNLTGKYQTFGEGNLDGLIAAWKPEDMLPRSYKDTREMPLSVSLDESSAPEQPVAAEAKPATELTGELTEKLDSGSTIVTSDGMEVLSDAITDVQGDVYAFNDTLSSPTIAAAMARLSRRSDDMRVTLLEEFIGKEDKDNQLLSRVITAYGDDSVQQLAGLHFVVENASNLLTKKLEWGRLAAYLEQSTRYIYFDHKDKNGNFKYYTPRNLNADTAREYEQTMDEIFKTYSRMVRDLTHHVRSNSGVPKNEQDVAWKGATRAQACDAIRDVLPVATKSTVGIFASAQAAENLYMNLLSDELDESRVTADALLKQFREVMPIFFERADKPDRGGATVAYRAQTKMAMKEIAENTLPQTLSPPSDDVVLTDYWPKNELELLPHMLFEHSSLPLEEIENEVADWPYADRMKVFRTYMGERLNRRHKPGRALENAHYSFELMCDYGIFRDLQRHRMVDDLNWQQLTPRFGYDVPELVEEAGLTEQFEKCFDLSYQLYSTMQAAGYETEAQYATLMGHKMRWRITYNARAAFHLHELRTTPHGHPGYRKLVKKMHDTVAEVHPTIAESMIFVNKDEDPELTRLAAERYTQFKLEQLGGGSD